MKKRNKIALVSLVAIVGLVLVFIVMNKTVQTEFESLNETDKQMLTELSTIYKHFEQSSDQLWNEEYDFRTLPLLLVHTNKDRGFFRKEAFAVNVKQFENSMFATEIKVPESFGLPKVYRVSRFDPSTISAWMPFNFATLEMDDTEAMYYKYHPKMFSDPELYFDFSSFLLHESFHIFKQKKWTYDADGAEFIDNYPVTEENYALMGLEFKLLDQAMATNDTDTIKQHLREWAIVRNYRYQKWPQLVGETKTEAIEGSARYIEYRYSELTGGKLTVLATKEAPYHVTFRHVLDVSANGQLTPRYLVRSIRYETGSALELLMDKAAIPWKAAVEDHPQKPGQTQYEIVKSYFNIQDSSSVEKEIESIKSKYGYEALLEQGAKIVKWNKEEQ
ncbi:hypothetical protein [Brevibacillus fortis]|uniref:Uncharacterized protein n=1 Tax=Brevibacillus fortis TaxID=2126352 RepID=A0A2P7VIQ3_9BACL|nr:hypothetical protein [Brevibacillus fortis]PSJ99087.1 hypothetical protein C7R93_05555 [Brevibacillus fortis]